VRFNLSKCKFGVQEVTYFGQMIGNKGIHPNPEKLHAINAMLKPANKEELTTLLGMLNYLARYIPNRSTKCKDFCDIYKEKDFVWETKHNVTLKKNKGLYCVTLSFL
jgi:hypothetical protein